MGKKPKRKAVKKSQRERFIETVRDLGASESEQDFEGLIRRLVPPKPRPIATKRR